MNEFSTHTPKKGKKGEISWKTGLKVLLSTNITVKFLDVLIVNFCVFILL